MSSKIKVRTIRPHDTSEGMKLPGDVYGRTKEDADSLSALGVVRIVATAKPKDGK